MRGIVVLFVMFSTVDQAPYPGPQQSVTIKPSSSVGGFSFYWVHFSRPLTEDDADKIVRFIKAVSFHHHLIVAEEPTIIFSRRQPNTATVCCECVPLKGSVSHYVEIASLKCIDQEHVSVSVNFKKPLKRDLSHPLIEELASIPFEESDASYQTDGNDPVLHHDILIRKK